MTATRHGHTRLRSTTRYSMCMYDACMHACKCICTSMDACIYRSESRRSNGAASRQGRGARLRGAASFTYASPRRSEARAAPRRRARARRARVSRRREERAEASAERRGDSEGRAWHGLGRHVRARSFAPWRLKGDGESRGEREQRKRGWREATRRGLADSEGRGLAPRRVSGVACQQRVNSVSTACKRCLHPEPARNSVAHLLEF